MAYTPTVWETGDTITAEKLNKAENGIAANSVLAVAVSKEDSAYTADAEYADVCAAVAAGKSVRLVYTQEGVGPLPTFVTYFDLCKAAIVSEEYVGLYFLSGNVGGGGTLDTVGLQWTSDGISDWPES